MQQKAKEENTTKGAHERSKNDLHKNACYPGDKQAYKWISMDIKGIQ